MCSEIRARSLHTTISIFLFCSHQLSANPIADQSHILHRCQPHTTCVDNSYEADGCREKLMGPANESTTYFATSCTSCACINLEPPSLSTVSKQRKLLVLGLTKQFNSISAPVMAWLHHLTCSGPTIGLETHVHILTSPPKRKMQADGKWHFTNEWVHKGLKTLLPCNTHIHIDANELKQTYSQTHFKLLGRVGKIAKLRDVLRNIAFERYFSNSSASFRPSVVAAVDFDMMEMPVLPAILEGIDHVSGLREKEAPEHKLTSVDALCANGRDGTNVLRRFYYDIFATILLPNTFVFPLDKRKYPKLFPNEDETRIVHTPRHGEDVYKLFTREDLSVLFNGGASVYPVRSCFGGITLYKPEVYFSPQCQYTIEPKVGRVGESEYNPGDRYSCAADDSTEAAACEHVIFHECLRKERGLNIAIGRDLVALWTKTSVHF
eukprot:m.1010871 g.1010871  ORF g.1010871 m.1010871 type:complete len:436 (-) comp24061_c0_seq23:2748-4055(-)